jgi:hypothetical protein
MKNSWVGKATVPGRISLAVTEARPTELFSYNTAPIQAIYNVCQKYFPMAASF